MPAFAARPPLPHSLNAAACRRRHRSGLRRACVAAAAPEVASARGVALAAVAAAVSGSLVGAPLTALLVSLAPPDFQLSPLLSAQWELDSDTLALTAAFLGAALSRVPSGRLELVLLTSLARASAHVHASAGCTATPLVCGGSYFDAAMTGDFVCTFIVSAAAFAAADAAVEALRQRQAL